MRSEIVLIPAKGIGTGKSRLMEVLVPASREALNRAQLIQTVSAAAETFGHESTYVVSPCERVEAIVRAAGVGFIRERVPLGLNQALEQARSELRRAGPGALCVLPVDLPDVSAAVLHDLLRHRDPGRPFVVPDRAADGTNFLHLPAGCELLFSYGPGSFSKHVRLLAQAGWILDIVANTCLRDDLDDARQLRLHDTYRELLAA